MCYKKIWLCGEMGEWKRIKKAETNQMKLTKTKTKKSTDEKDNGDTEEHDRQEIVLSALTTSSSFRSSI